MNYSEDKKQVYITAMGIVSPAGIGVEATRQALLDGTRHLNPITVFAVPDQALPVGEVRETLTAEDVPRTHKLAMIAAGEALAGADRPPDAIVLGCTTGGMATTEELLKNNVKDPAAFRFHGTGSVAEWLADKTGCAGPAITISTACSSSAVALKIALDMLRAGKAARVLAGGVDSLCRLTYHGFRMLQLIDPQGTRPLDRDRAGMTVGEGAGLMLLTISDTPPDNALAVFSGGGLSCDAYHPSAPHPEGAGAVDAINLALNDAGVTPEQIDYINMHGTGTRDNDASESRAILTIYPDTRPALSSTKGIFGHSLAASGAIEAVVSVLTLNNGTLPVNVGCQNVDKSLGLSPILKPVHSHPDLVLSNSFGFGGNNAALIFGKTGSGINTKTRNLCQRRLKILGSACITGAGGMTKTLDALTSGRKVAGIMDGKELVKDLPPRKIRRLRRLPRLALSLASSAISNAKDGTKPSGIYVGTGWGPMSETHAFLDRLFRNNEQSSSPTDFVGSIHNAVSSQIAIWFNAKGPNITATNGDFSFQDALFAASFTGNDKPFLLCGVDEAHETLSPLLDPSVAAADVLADGGGAFMAVKAKNEDEGPFIFPAFLARRPGTVEPLIQALGGPNRIRDDFAAILLGIPASNPAPADTFLAKFIDLSGFDGPVIPYRPLLGEFATASAIAIVLATNMVKKDSIPGALIKENRDLSTHGKGILVLDIDSNLSAIEVTM